jgi:hypothetical protein
MITLADLKSEYRLVSSGDPWGDCMSAWFDCAEFLHATGADIPAHWEFRPSPVLRTVDDLEDGYWRGVFEQTDEPIIVEFGNLLCRLAGILRACGKDY